ncbi:unnamed protein product [Cylicocyclus nassatus]|uniref:Uncharacterized protein n=1 Tax=Cylicocyclus nassatus TaxID=53992 RepID=A0AA36DI01_CYLNA|nr:unnamed protein product [Cylicocyclus nassatus]
MAAVGMAPAHAIIVTVGSTEATIDEHPENEAALSLAMMTSVILIKKKIRIPKRYFRKRAASSNKDASFSRLRSIDTSSTKFA